MERSGNTIRKRIALHIVAQAPHRLRDELAGDILGIDAARLRVVVPEVGGAFGLKTGTHVEAALVLWAARRVGRPVK